ncbi:MAG: thiamine pyrophosphate-dependent enzyme [Acidobacteriaceae bacterium]
MAIEARNRVPSAAANGKNGHSLISNAKFRQLYELALKLQLQAKRANGEGSNWLRGREAMLAGVAADLRGDDAMVAGEIVSIAGALNAPIPFGTDKRSFEERVIAALSNAVVDRMRKTGRVGVIFFNGARGAEILKEARALAIAARLPVLFVEDVVPVRRSTKKKRAATIEYPMIPVDTRDVIAMYRVAHESIARAREGSGPTHIVGVEWRPVASGRKGTTKIGREDPVEHLEHWLIARGLPAQQWRREIVAEFATQGGSLSKDESAETRAIA